MDKYEYNLKLEEINKLVDEENYEDAARIADTVDWRRVRNVRTLCMISEIYEANNRLEDSKAILMRAYRRSQLGRMVLYRLTEIAIKMREFDEAIEYYTEFVNAAPNDNSRYILKYKIYKGRGSSLQDQITILEEYKEKEYTEKWAYELAKLYYKVGENEKCIEECDDLVLWFRQGEYVIKALELKKKLAPLDETQQMIYDRRNEMQSEDLLMTDEQVPELEKVILEKMPTSEEEAITDSIITETEKELAQAISLHAAEAEAERETTDESWRYHSGSIDMGNEVSSDTREFNAADRAVLNAALENAAPVDQAVQEEGTGFNVEDLQKELANSMREIVSGMTREESDEGIIEPMNDKPFFEEEPVEEPEEKKENIDDVLTAMAAQAAEEAPAAEAKEEPAEEEVPAAAEAKEEPAEEEVPAAAEAKEEPAEEEAPAAAEAKEEPVEAKAEPTAEEAPAAAQTEEVEDVSVETKQISAETITIPKYDTMDLSAALEIAAGIADMKPEESQKEPSFIGSVKETVPELTGDEAYIFSYFTSIQELRAQITQALYEAKKKVALDRTSKSGNIVITGLPGSGRTSLAIRFAKALSRERGEKSARIAKIYAEDFNKKDIPSTIAKIAGGMLIIEEAGDLEDQVVKQLSKAMEFRTEGLVIILEDEKHLLKELFDKHPDFAEKFTSEVSIPIFTNDELVAFGRTYASDEDYKIDDMATVALYNRIGDMQTSDHPVTVLDVKGIVDKAIKHSERFGVRKLGMILSGKRYDEDDRIVLYEKDFK